jgi:RNA polymerase sigma-70 factor (ECF subfamily)
MNQPAPLPLPIDDPSSSADSRRMYEDILVRAMRHAERLVPRDQAFEIAHDVAVELVRHPIEDVTGALVFIRVTSRLRNLWRGRDRRAAVDRVYLDQRSTTTPAWAQPDAELEARELRERLEAVVVRMPRAMREVFLLVREQELSYKEAAARLGVGVATVHTQLYRANALLRECVKQYEAGPSGTPPALRSPKGQQP